MALSCNIFFSIPDRSTIHITASYLVYVSLSHTGSPVTSAFSIIPHQFSFLGCTIVDKTVDSSQ